MTIFSKLFKSSESKKPKALKLFSERDFLNYILHFREFRPVGYVHAEHKITKEVLHKIKTLLTQHPNPELELPMDETSQNMLILDLYRMKERMKKSGFTPTLNKLITSKFKSLGKKPSVKDITLYCVERLATARMARAQKA